MRNRVAVSVVVFLLALTVPSLGQTSDEDSRTQFLAATMQAPSQVSTANTTPGERKLSQETLPGCKCMLEIGRLSDEILELLEIEPGIFYPSPIVQEIQGCSSILKLK